MMIPSIVRLDILFESISLILSLSIGSVSFFAWRRLGARTLLLFALGFFLMAAAMLIRVVVVSLAFSPFFFSPPLRSLPFLVLQLQETVYSLIRLLSYIIFLYLYAAHPLKKSQGVALLAPVSLIYNPFFEAVSAMILGFVVFQLATTSKEVRPSYGTAAFSLLLISHVLFIATPLSLNFYILAHFVQMLSLILFLTAVSMVLRHGERL
ncbi:MAG: hypothetical protein RMH74_07465 [Candidatus Caldarchaeum sp.]|nr:hypothetical protein [Candidatus Caldarchaeum sp.]